MPLALEPVMHVVISVSHEFGARAEACVPAHRGRVISSELRAGTHTIRAHVPHATLAAFVSELMSETHLTARTSMVLYEYWPTLQPPPDDPAARS